MTDTSRLTTEEWQLCDAWDLEAWRVEPVSWLVDPIIPAGSVGFMCGQPKLGKSLLALDLSLHLANAHLEQTKWLGRFECSPSKILYVAREDPASRIKERGLEISQTYGWSFVMPETLHFLIRERINLLDQLHLDWLGQQIEEREIDFLILDVFNRMIPGLDENSAKDMAQAVDVIEDLNRTYGVTILMLDHTRKPAVGQKTVQEPNPFELRGSTAKYGCADFMICVGRTKQHGRLQVYCENKDTDQCPNFLVDVSPKGSTDPKFRWAGDVLQLREDRKSVGKHNRQRVLETVRESESTGISKHEICAKTGLSPSTVGSHLAVLKESDAINQVGENKQTRYVVLTDRPGVPLRPSDSVEA